MSGIVFDELLVYAKVTTNLTYLNTIIAKDMLSANNSDFRAGTFYSSTSFIGCNIVANTSEVHMSWLRTPDGDETNASAIIVYYR